MRTLQALGKREDSNQNKLSEWFGFSPSLFPGSAIGT